MSLDYKEFVRRPFAVEAVEITLENMEEVAKLIGTVRKHKDILYISIDGRVVPNVKKAYVGWWMTLMDNNYRVYSPKLFKSEFLAYEESMTFTFDDDEVENDESKVVTVPEGVVGAVSDSNA